MDPSSDFQKKIVEYLESAHVSEFMTGTMADVKEQVHKNMKTEEYHNPTQTFHILNLQIVTVNNVKLVKIQLIGGTNSRIL